MRETSKVFFERYLNFEYKITTIYFINKQKEYEN